MTRSICNASLPPYSCHTWELDNRDFVLLIYKGFPCIGSGGRVALLSPLLDPSSNEKFHERVDGWGVRSIRVNIAVVHRPVKPGQSAVG
jgi:hypothetical protein